MDKRTKLNVFDPDGPFDQALRKIGKHTDGTPHLWTGSINMGVASLTCSQCDKEVVISEHPKTGELVIVQ